MGTIKVLEPGEQWTCEAACRDSRTDYEIKTVPTLAPDPWNQGHFVIDDNEVAIMRQPIPDDPVTRRFGNAKAGWTPIQNLDIARLIDRTLGDNYPCESMGALGHGETLFISLDAGEDEIAGERYHQYVGIVDGKAANRALTIVITCVRFVCQNTVLLGLEKASFTHKLRHISGLEYDLVDRLNVVQQIHEGQQATREAMEILARARINPTQEQEIIQFAYRTPNKSSHVLQAEQLDLASLTPERAKVAKDRIEKYDYWVRSFETMRASATDRLMQFNDEFPKLARTPYAVLQAVIENEDYRRGNKLDGGKQAAVSAVFGERAAYKLRAYLKAAQLAGSPYIPKRERQSSADLLDS